jgi:DNA topoisomerase-1
LVWLKHPFLLLLSPARLPSSPHSPLTAAQPLRAHIEAQRAAKKEAPAAEKEAARLEKAALQLQFGFALVDGHLEKMGNYTVEPPGLFRGRGEHPKMGVLKKRVVPEDITINVAHTAVVPPCPVPGHSWRRVVHDPTVTWLAYWREKIMGGHK